MARVRNVYMYARSSEDFSLSELKVATSECMPSTDPFSLVAAMGPLALPPTHHSYNKHQRHQDGKVMLTWLPSPVSIGPDLFVGT